MLERWNTRILKVSSVAWGDNSGDQRWMWMVHLSDIAEDDGM